MSDVVISTILTALKCNNIDRIWYFPRQLQIVNQEGVLELIQKLVVMSLISLIPRPTFLLLSPYFWYINVHSLQIIEPFVSSRQK